MRSKPSPTRFRAAKLLALVTAGSALAALVGDAAADDRNLFRGAADAPYIFAMFDVSGSMASPATCSGENCDTLGAADAPDSRMYQLKSALYDIVRDDRNANVRWGFAKFNQIDPAISRKNWLYQRKPGQTWDGSSNPPWWNTLAWPVLDDQVWFGNNGSRAAVGTSCSDRYRGTAANFRLYLSDFPKLGHNGTASFEAWASPGDTGPRIRINIAGMAPPLGTSAWTHEIALTVRVRTYNSCSDASNSNPATDSGPQTVLFVPYYDQDSENILFTSGGGQLGFDFIAREGGFVTPNTRNRFGPVGTMHTYDPVCTSSNPVKWEPNETPSTGLTDGDSTTFMEYPNFDDPLGR
ncbi:MAG TPA: hypothetical protein VNB06_18605, partial [Thermoanaerobaculia bacterium]|nr:hypothetical protein [Thermoanaerobaculia bacterium]